MFFAIFLGIWQLLSQYYLLLVYVIGHISGSSGHILVHLCVGDVVLILASTILDAFCFKSLYTHFKYYMIYCLCKVDRHRAIAAGNWL